MDGMRISIYIRLACMTAAVIFPIELFAQRPTSTRPTRGNKQANQGAARTQPAVRGQQPGEPVPPPPDIDQLRQLIRSRRPKRTTTQAAPSAQMVNPARGPVATAQASPRIEESCPVPTTLPAGEKAIQFCFNNAPYSAVFDFIERISGLPILGDRNIQGTVTYFSRKKMTLNEALEELNLLLKDKGVVVARTEDHLRISKFPDVLRDNIVDFVNAESFMTSDVSATQVVRVFFRVDNLSAEELTNLLADALPVNEVKLAAWRTTNQIQIVGLASQVRKIIQLAKKLDTGLKTSEAGLDMKVFKPKYISPTALERILRTMMPASGVVGPGNVQLGEPGAGPRSANVIRGGESAMQIAADDITGTLVVRGNTAMIGQVNKIVDMLDVQEEAGNIKAVRIPIQFGSIQTIEMVLNESVRQRADRSGRSQMTMSVRGDEATRSIVLAGSRTLVDQAEQMIKVLDKPTVTTRLTVIPLKTARVEEVMRDVLTPFYRSARREVPAAADQISNSIVTWATASDLDDMKSLLSELDAAAKEGKGVPVVRVYQMEDVDVNRLAGTLQQMFARQGNVTFGADPVARTLLVAGPADKLDRIEKTINELKATPGSKTVTELVKLKYANAEQVASAVRGAFATRRSPTGEARAEISWNVQANTVLVTGMKSSVDEAVNLIRELDEQIRTTSAIKSYPLKYAQADDLAKMIQDLYMGKEPTLKVVSEPWSNTLFISGGAGVISAIEQLIKTADHSEPMEMTSNNVAFITLKTASATEVADQVSSMLSAGTTNTKNLPQIDAAESGNYLIVTGQPKQIERVRQLAEQVDKMAQQVPEILAVRPIQKISAERLAQMLNVIVPQIAGTRVNLVDVNMSNARSGWQSFLSQRPESIPLTTRPGAAMVTIGVDKGNNTLIIRGKPKDIEEIDKQIANLTADVQADVQFKVYTLKYASPSDVALSLESLFNEIPVMGQLVPPQPQPQPNPQTQNLPPGAQQQQRTRQPQQRQGQASAARRIRAIPVEQTNSVVVRADPRDFQTVEEFVGQLDQADIEAVKIYRLKYARADAVARNIMDLFGGSGGIGRRFRQQMQMTPGAFPMFGGVPGQEMKVSYDMTSNSVIVAGGRSRYRDIAEVIESLDKPEGAGMEVRILPLKNGKAEQLAPMIQNVMQQAENTLASQRGLSPQTIAISFDKRTNSLIVAGTSRQYEQVKSLVDRLESVRSSGGERRRFVIPLRNMDPNQAKQLLEQLLPPGQTSVWPKFHGLPGLRNQVGFALYSAAMGQTTRRAMSHVTTRSAATRPARKKQGPLVGNEPERSMKLAIIQQMLEAQRKQPAQSQGKPSIVIMPTPIPFGTTTAPAFGAKDTEKRFGKTIVQPGSTKGASGAAPTTADVKELKTIADRVTGSVEITAVPEQNALVIDATEQDYKVIEQLLGMLDQARPTPKVEIFKLKNARATELAEVVGRLFANRPMPKGFPPITLTPDTATNSIIVSSSPEILDEIRQIVTQLDAQEQIPQMDFRVYSLKNARASQLVPQLQTMLQQIMAARGITQLPFSVSADDRTNTIIVTAPPTYLDQIGKLIQTMDTVPSFATAILDVVRLKQADAEAIGKILSGLASPAAKGGQAGQSQELVNRLLVTMEKAGQKATLDLEKPIKIIPDRPSQSILVLSTAENNRVLRQLITTLDKVPLAENLFVRIFPLKHADADDVRKALDAVFSKGQSLTKTPGTEHAVGVPENTTGQALVYNVTIAADKASNTLIASGHEASLALMEVLVRQLDQENPNTVYPIRTIGLANSSAKDLSKLLEDIMTARANRAKALGANRAAEKSTVIIRADERINMLLVSASKDEFDTISQLVKKLDVPPEVGAAPTLIPLKVVDAQTMAELLDKFFKERNQVKAVPTETKPAFPATTPVIIPELRSNTLIVSAGKKTLSEIRDLVDRLDNAVITRRMQLAVIPLQSADASQLAQAITQLLNPTREQAGLKQAVILEFIRQTPEGKSLVQRALKDQVFVYGDKTSNLLLAVAPSDTISLIEELVKTIDAVAPSVEIRVIALVNADAEQMKKVVQELFGIGKSGGTSQVPTRFTTTGPAIAMEATAVSTEEGSKLEKESLAVTADTRTNSLILSGSSTYLKMVESIIKELDAKAIEQQQTEVIPLKNAKADTVQKAVETLIQNRVKMYQEVYGQQGLAPERLLEQQVNVVADTDSRKLILQASPRYFAAVRRIIDELDQAPSQVMIQAMIAEVTLDGRIEWGFEAVGQDLSFTKAQTAPGIGPGHDVVVGTDIGASGGAGPAGFVFSLHGEDFNLLLRALNSDGKLQVLSRPQIMARDNAEASIQIGQEVPYPTGSNISPDTGNVTTTIQYEKVGVILKVVPHINPEGYVILEVEPEISSLSTSNVQISEGLSAPIINKNTAKTIVTIKDGETVVIGGLITKRMDHREVKVPFLGDIPLLGLAFKSIVDTESRSELLIILTPKLVDSVGKARAISEDERDLLELLPREIRESRLMGRLQQTFDEEGFVVTTQPACTQPATVRPGEQVEEIQVESGQKLFDKPRCNEQLFRAFNRTCDQ